MRSLDELPGLPDGHLVEQASSHSRAGINDDSGWFLYRDAAGDAVIFDAIGPGCVKSIWSTAFPDDQELLFTFDGEVEPRFAIRTRDLFEGTHALFPSPLASYLGTGRYNGLRSAGNAFVPIPFQTSLRISVRGPVTFYHILFERYPHGVELRTFTGMEDHRALEDAFARPGDEPEPDASTEVLQVALEGIDPGASVDVVALEGARMIRRLVVEAPATSEVLQGVDIEMVWDGAPVPDVSAPLGMFYACPREPTDVRTLPIRVECLDEGRMRLTSYLRMPFWRSGTVRLVNRTASPTGPLSIAVHAGPQPFAEGAAGYLTTQYRSGRTEMGRDWTFFESDGTGWFIGVVQTMLGGHYCEGDEHFTVDGTAMPQVNGTGTEDYYLACYWPNRRFDLPFAGCVGDVFLEGGGHLEGAYRRTACYYRFHLEAPIPFYSGIAARIQHGGASDIVSTYGSLGFGYLRRRPALTTTDLVDVANPASERMHGYVATGATWTGELDGRYEGQDLRTVVRDSGRSHGSGEIRFSACIRPANEGVRLRRRLDQASPRQRADVYVDGEFAGTWYHPDVNPHLRWYDSDIALHPRHTRGKERIEVALVVSGGDGHGAFTDFRYEVMTLEDRPASRDANPPHSRSEEVR